MARWECIVCGLIYDEREGWPEDGIAAGTRWADVPDDWTCPDCGVGKDDFELVPGSESDEMPPATMTESEQSASEGAETQTTSEAVEQPVTMAASGHVVIVGSGLAGFGLARELRRHNPELPITLVTADGGEVYSKPLLSTGYTKKLGYEQLALQTAEDFAVIDDATHRNPAEIHTVIATLASNQAGAAALADGPLIGQRNFQSRFNRLRARIREEHMLKRRRRHIPQARGQFKRHGMPHLERRRIVQFACLFADGFDNFGAIMPCVAAPQSRRAIQNITAIRGFVEHPIG